MQNEVLDEILLTHADGFEAGNRTVRNFTPKSPEEYVSLRECLATLTGEGSLVSIEGANAYKLTQAGYARY